MSNLELFLGTMLIITLIALARSMNINKALIRVLFEVEYEARELVKSLEEMEDGKNVDTSSNDAKRCDSSTVS